MISSFASEWFRKQFDLQYQILQEQKGMRERIATIGLRTAFQAGVTSQLPALPAKTDEQFTDLGRLISNDEKKRQALVSSMSDFVIKSL